MDRVTPPYLSLGFMLGDAHVPVLRRFLLSVLVRSSGAPLVDEIVLGWNGSEDTALRATLETLEYQLHDASSETQFWAAPHKPPLTLVSFKWPGRFDTARNVWWKHLKGEWLLWLDGDDVVADGGTLEGLAAIEACMRDYNVPMPPPSSSPGGGTLKELLRSLPAGVNTVLAPYDYNVDANGYCVVRQNMKRLVRASAGHIWYSPEASGIHEVLLPARVQEASITTLGLLVRHLPVEEDAARIERNRTIMEAMLAARPKGVLLGPEPRFSYDLANVSIVAGDWAQADASLHDAIAAANNDADRYVYRLARSSLMLQRNNPQAALQEALAAVGLMPELQDAYYVATEALFHLQKWSGVVEFFERGRQKQAVLMALDQPMGKWVSPRMQAAVAYSKLEQPEKGVPLVLEARERYPLNTLCRELGESILDDAKAKVGREKLLDTIEWLAAGVSPALARAILQGVESAAAFRDFAKSMRVQRLGAKVSQEAGFTVEQRPLQQEDAEPWPSTLSLTKPGGEPMDLLDVLREAARDNMRLLKVTPVGRGFQVRWRPAVGRSFTFYCPAAVYEWKPSDVEVAGLGGSEGSVAYLARQLALMGRRVTVYSLSSSSGLWQGKYAEKDFSVEQHPLKDFYLDSRPGDILISCRAPWMAREVQPHVKTWCWHQDNGYDNPWMWSSDAARHLVGNLHVSEWAKRGLLRELGEETGPHPVLGNGITQECLEWTAPRDPKHVLYASDPTRGLQTLLDAWPEVLKAHPNARLTVACDFRVMAVLHQPSPGLPALEVGVKLRQQMASLPNVIFKGWLAHPELLALMQTASIYCYPGGPMPEGFGVSLVQAQACGCTVICPPAGALPEVLDPANTFYGADVRPMTVEGVIYALKARLDKPEPEIARRQAAEALFERHGWPTVAARFVQLVDGETP